MVLQKNIELKPLNIAIDGYSGCGKSTLASDLATSLGYINVDTGALYRGMTLALLKNGIRDFDQDLTAELSKLNPQFSFESGTNHLLLDGANIESAIRNDKAIASNVSDVAAVPAVRTYLLQLQRAFISKKCVVMEGRDIGSVIMPDADLKLFITATIDERVKRRYLQLKTEGRSVSEKEVRDNLLSRDKKDAQRHVAPLKKPTDAICIDTSQLSREEQLAFVLTIVRPLQSPSKYLPFIQ